MSVSRFRLPAPFLGVVSKKWAAKGKRKNVADVQYYILAAPCLRGTAGRSWAITPVRFYQNLDLTVAWTLLPKKRFVIEGRGPPEWAFHSVAETWRCVGFCLFVFFPFLGARFGILVIAKTLSCVSRVGIRVLDRYFSRGEVKRKLL